MLEKLIALLTKDSKVFENEPMKNHTTFRIGGPADILVVPKTVEDIKTTLTYFKDEKIFIMGNGSNLLVNDDGIRGVVIKISDGLSDIDVVDNKIIAGAGASFSKVAMVAQGYGLTGMEWSYGIPGSIGGAITMNAGAYGGEIKDILLETTYIDEAGNLSTIYNDEHEFAYRSSIFSKNKVKGIIVRTKLGLNKGNSKEIEEKMKEILNKRKEKQPLEYPSAGSVFKRPEGFYVGALIDELGLKGYTIGGAQVSKKHGGFIINIGGATASDVKELINYIVKKVKERYNITLETEIKMV